MIIAEASLQHHGDWEKAADIARVARFAGADAVKFQLFVHNEVLFCPLPGDNKRISKWMASVMSQKDWSKAALACEGLGIDFMASVFQPGAVELYKSLNPKWWKVASRAAKDFPYEYDQNYIISCGADPRPIKGQRGHQFYYLQCCMKYPHDPIRWAPRRTLTDGLSDHSGSPWPSIHALGHKAKVIEVHVHFGREQKLPEEITLDELKLICEARDAFAALR